MLVEPDPAIRKNACLFDCVLLRAIFRYLRIDSCSEAEYCKFNHLINKMMAILNFNKPITIESHQKLLINDNGNFA